MHLLYNLAIYLYGLAVSFASFFISKAKLWHTGRKQWKEKLKTALEKKPAHAPVFWMHCASLGEYEQGRMLMERYKIAHPETFVLLTFFSPSGYEVKKDAPYTNYVCYLPLDTPGNAKDFIKIVKPNIVVFVRYEFWYNYLKTLYTQNIPVYLISSVFEHNSIVFRSLGKLHREMLTFYRKVFVQDTYSEKLLKEKLNIEAIVAGDTRIDAIIENKMQGRALPDQVVNWAKHQKVFVFASIYPNEMPFIKKIAKELIGLDWLVLIVPHQIKQQDIQLMSNQLSYHKPAIFTKLKDNEPIESKVLIIDTIGMLKSLYRLASAAYIGGALQGGNVHNVLEAAVYQMPTYFGTSRRRFVEIEYLVKANLAKQLPISKTELEQQQAGDILLDDLPYRFESQTYVEMKEGLHLFFEQHKEGTANILSYIEEIPIKVYQHQ